MFTDLIIIIIIIIIITIIILVITLSKSQWIWQSIVALLLEETTNQSESHQIRSTLCLLCLSCVYILYLIIIPRKHVGYEMILSSHIQQAGVE